MEQRFDRYREVTGLSDKSEEAQVSTLVYAMGEQAEDILTSLALTEDEAELSDGEREIRVSLYQEM